jgi:hypothetical protein
MEMLVLAESSNWELRVLIIERSTGGFHYHTYGRQEMLLCLQAESSVQ